MKKFIKILSVIPLLGSLSSNIYLSNDDLSSPFIQLENGDFALKDRGSVTDELTRYGIDVIDYQMGLKGNSSLMVAESDSGVYLYIFNENGFLDYDKCSFGYYSGDLINFNYDSLQYYEKDITLVSFDETHKIGKFLINDIASDISTDHIYLIREIYQESNKSESEFVQGIGLVYQYDSETSLSKITSEETIKVINKLVGYEVYPYKEGDVDKVYQRNYVAFSTEKKMEDLLKVKLKYDGYYYGGYTDINFNYNEDYWSGLSGFKNFAEDLENKDILNHMDKSTLKKQDEFKDKVTEIEDEIVSFSVTYDNERWFYFNKKDVNESFTYSTIENTSELNQDNLINKDILNYDYIVTFDAHPVNCVAVLKNTGAWFWENTSSLSNIFVGMGSTTFWNSDAMVEAWFDNLKDNEEFLKLWKEETGKDVFTLEDFRAYFQSIANDNYIFADSFTTNDIQGYIDSGKLKYSDYSRSMLEVENLTLLEFTYLEDGEEKKAVAVDTYTDSSGGNQINDNDVTFPEWDEFVENFKNFFSNDNPIVIAVKVILGVLCGLFIIWVVVKLINLFKSLKK